MLKKKKSHSPSFLCGLAFFRQVGRLHLNPPFQNEAINHTFSSKSSFFCPRHHVTVVAIQVVTHFRGLLANFFRFLLVHLRLFLSLSFYSSFLPSSFFFFSSLISRLLTAGIGNGWPSKGSRSRSSSSNNRTKPRTEKEK